MNSPMLMVTKALSDDDKIIHVISFFHQNLNEYKIADYGIAFKVGYTKLDDYQMDMINNFQGMYASYDGRRVVCFENKKSANKALDYLMGRIIMNKLRCD